MNQTQFFEDFEALPPNAQQELIDFMMRLKQRYEKSKPYKNMQHDWDSHPFFGMWKDRTDMVDSSAWVRSLREKEWG